MKRVLKRMLICLLVFLTLFNFTMDTGVYAGTGEDFFNTAYSLLVNLLGAFVGYMTWIPRILMVGIGAAVQALVSGIASLGGVTSSGLMVTPFTIFFNKVPMLDVNFMEFTGVVDMVKDFRTVVATWYYVMRMIATGILLLILIYIGIRMAISSVASDKAVYKKMLTDWAMSLALLYLLHYFIIFVIKLNASFVKILASLGDTESVSNFTSFTGSLLVQSLSGASGFAGIVSTIVYLMVIGQTIKFLLMYMKRMITVGFLIIISPLITITYSIDKIGDQRAQALNTWMKEFCYNILIQPFHCIMYLAFVNVTMQLIGPDIVDGITAALSFIPGMSIIAAAGNAAADTATGNNTLAAGVLAIVCLHFIDDGEAIIRKIFGFDKAGSLQSAAAAAVAMGTLAKNAGNIGKSAAKTAKMGKNLFKATGMTERLAKDMNVLKKGTSRLGEKLNKGAESLRDKSNTKRENKIDEKAQALAMKRGNNWDNISDATKESLRNEVRNQMFSTKAQKAFSSAKGTAKNMSEKVSSSREKMKENRENKINEKAMALAEKEGHNWDTMGDEAKENYKNRAKDSLTSSKLKAGVGKAGNFAITGAKTAFSNKELIARTTGAAAAAIMYGASSDGALKSIIAAKGVSEFTSEMFKNSKKQISSDIQETLQTSSNITGEDFKTDKEKENFLNAVKFMGDNGRFSPDAINKELDKFLTELETRIQGLTSTEATNCAARIQQELASNPGNFNLDDALSRSINGYDSLSDSAKAGIRDSAQSYTDITTKSKLYDGIQTAATVGLGTAAIASAISSITSSSTTTTHVKEVTTVEEYKSYETQDLTSAVEQAISKIDAQSSMGNNELQSNLNAIQAQLDKLGTSNQTETQRLDGYARQYQDLINRNR